MSKGKLVSYESGDELRAAERRDALKIGRARADDSSSRMRVSCGRIRESLATP